MRERTALSCLDCEFSVLLNTPETQEALLDLIEKYKSCPDCGKQRIVQAAWIDEYGNMGT